MATLFIFSHRRSRIHYSFPRRLINNLLSHVFIARKFCFRKKKEDFWSRARMRWRGVGGLNMTFWDKMKCLFVLVGTSLDLSLFHALCRLVFFLIGIIVRFLAIQLARVALSFNAVVVWVLRTSRRPVECRRASSLELKIAQWWLTCTDCWTMLDYCQNSCLSAVTQELTVAQRHSILAVNCLENCLKNHCKSLKYSTRELHNSPMRLGDTGADRGIPNGVLNPWLPRCLLLR